jgi:hypothetical protein
MIHLRPVVRPVQSRPDQICVTLPSGPASGHTRGLEASYRTLDREARERLAASGWSVDSPVADGARCGTLCLKCLEKRLGRIRWTRCR